MPISGLPIYVNVTKVNIVVTKTVTMHSIMFSQKVCLLHNDNIHMRLCEIHKMLQSLVNYKYTLVLEITDWIFPLF